jgi:phytanoyl-CoA dioxygenase PhyH
MDSMSTPVDQAVWQTQGFWTSEVPLVSRRRIAFLRRRAQAVLRGKYDTGRSPLVQRISAKERGLRVIDNPHWADSVLHQLVELPELGALASQMMTRSTAVRLWGSQLIEKLPRGGQRGTVGWHQDMAYWRCVAPAELVTAWLPLNDVDASSGCLQFIPGSHLWGLAELSGFHDSDLARQTTALRSRFGDFATCSLSLSAGHVSFHHCLTFHCSGENHTNRSRIALAVHFMPDHAWYVGGTLADWHVNVTLLGGRHGDRFQGDHFPIVYRP